MRPGAHVLLVGMMGSGKSTVARFVAATLGRPVADCDEEVERATGRRVSAIFAEDGEDAFRHEEARALRRLLDGAPASVVAVGGGTVLDPANRVLLRRSGTVVWLRAQERTLLERLGSGEGRALLRPDPAAVVPRLLELRGPIYDAVADVTVDVDSRRPEEVADEIVARLVRAVRVELGDRGYDVLVGPGARHRLGEVLPTRARRAALVTQEGIDLGLDPGIETVRITVGDGESAKSLETVGSICRQMARAGLTRHDVVVAVGGGVVTDVAGFAASCYYRGVDVVHVSTTLLGQVDAAIGGKTGVNLPEGKNLVGTFWQPRAVLCDTDALATLPEREWRSGLGEMAKYAFLGVDDLDARGLDEQVLACAALKAAVVAEDERESERRMLLNYGHTLAHALEAAGFSAGVGEDPVRLGAAASGAEPLRHGEAVGIGLVFAARLAELLGRIDRRRVDRHVELVAGYGLPTAVPDAAPADELVLLMARDKKATDGLTFVLDGPRGPEVVRGVDRSVVEAALEGSREAGMRTVDR